MEIQLILIKIMIAFGSNKNLGGDFGDNNISKTIIVKVNYKPYS
jgi:hypothetical protein